MCSWRHSGLVRGLGVRCRARSLVERRFGGRCFAGRRSGGLDRGRSVAGGLRWMLLGWGACGCRGWVGRGGFLLSGGSGLGWGGLRFGSLVSGRLRSCWLGGGRRHRELFGTGCRCRLMRVRRRLARRRPRGSRGRAPRGLAPANRPSGVCVEPLEAFHSKHPHRRHPHLRSRYLHRRHPPHLNHQPPIPTPSPSRSRTASLSRSPRPAQRWGPLSKANPRLRPTPNLGVGSGWRGRRSLGVGLGWRDRRLVGVGVGVGLGLGWRSRRLVGVGWWDCRRRLLGLGRLPGGRWWLFGRRWG